MRVIVEPKVFTQGVMAQTGASADVLQAWQEALFELVISEEWLSSAGRLFHQLTPLHQQADYTIQSFLELIIESSWEWKSMAVANHLSHGIVDYIITYDIHLDLQTNGKILTPDEFMIHLYPTEHTFGRTLFLT